MYFVLQELLSDKKGGEIFTCFGLWHLLWIGLTAVLGAVLCLSLRKQGRETRKKFLRGLSGLAFGLYILDFFLMPLAYGAIDVEKLPFHACTASCVLCFLSSRSGVPGQFRASFAVLGFVSNLVYLFYPAGVMWNSVHPLCYRVLQTMGFHALMTVACLMTLLFGEDLGHWRRHLGVTAGMTAWAMLGNWVYNSPERLYNWFFVVRDPFGVLPAELSPFVMPALNLALFFAVEMAVCAVCKEVRRAL